MVPPPQAVFLDTSIQIDRFLREVQMKRAIDATLSHFDIKVTSRVVQQEFKRRVLSEALYLLNQLNDTNSYQATLAHVTNVLTKHHDRKQKICLNLLQSCLPGASDEELTERARRYLRVFLVHGQESFQSSVDSVVYGTGCYWSTQPIVEEKRYEKYAMGPHKCSRSKGRCPVGQFLEGKSDQCKALLSFLESLPAEKKTDELTEMGNFIRVFLKDGSASIDKSEPCLKVGDLLIAFESEGFQNFFTKNYKESQVLCDFTGQNLLIRPNNPATKHIFCEADAKPWEIPG